MWTSTISSTRISPSAMADERSSFLRDSSMFMLMLSRCARRFTHAAIGGPGGACDISGVDGQIDPGDAAAHGRKQPRDGLCDLDRLDQPVHRGRTFQPFPV